MLNFLSLSSKITGLNFNFNFRLKFFILVVNLPF